jgi:hypothetical protein
MRVTYEPDTGSAYLYLTGEIEPGGVKKTISLYREHGINLDFDAAEHLIGIELLAPARLHPALVAISTLPQVRASNLDLRAKVLLSVQRALVGYVTTNIRFVACRWTSDAIEVRIIYNEAPASNDREDMSLVESEILADFPTMSVRIQCVESSAAPAALLLEGEVFVYGRREDPRAKER